MESNGTQGLVKNIIRKPCCGLNGINGNATIQVRIDDDGVTGIGGGTRGFGMDGPVFRGAVHGGRRVRLHVMNRGFLLRGHHFFWWITRIIKDEYCVMVMMDEEEKE